MSPTALPSLHPSGLKKRNTPCHRENFVPCEMSREIKEACASEVTLEVIPGAGHGLCYMVEPKRYEEATVKFIQSIVP